ARAQHVCAEHDAALHFGAEPLAAAELVHLCKRLRRRRAGGVTDAVVARQVGAGLGRADDVVAGNRVLGVRQADLNRLAAQSAQQPDALFHLLPGLVFQAREVLLRQPDPHSLDVLRERLAVVRHRGEGAGGVPGIAPGDGPQQHRRRNWPAGGSTRPYPNPARQPPSPAPPLPPSLRWTLPAPGPARPDCAPARRPNSRSTSPWRIRRSWSCRSGRRPPLRSAPPPWRRTAG